AHRYARAVAVAVIPRVVVPRVVNVRDAVVAVGEARGRVRVAVVAATGAVAALATGVGLVENGLDHVARDAGVVEGDHVVRGHVEAALALVHEGDDLLLRDARLLHADHFVDDVRVAARGEERRRRQDEKNGEEVDSFHGGLRRHYAVNGG